MIIYYNDLNVKNNCINNFDFSIEKVIEQINKKVNCKDRDYSLNG